MLQYVYLYAAVVLATFLGIVGVDRFGLTASFCFES